MFRNLLTKPQGETRNMFLLELTHTELKTDSEEAAAMNFAQEQQSAITGHSLSFCLFPTASRLQELLSSPAFSCCSWPKALPESCAELGKRCLPALSKAGLPAQTYTAKDLTLLGRRLNKNDGFESQHTFGCVIQNAQPGLSLGSTNDISVHGV